MGEIPSQPKSASGKTLGVAALIVALLAAALSLYNSISPRRDRAGSPPPSASSWAAAQKSKTLRIGVGQFPPYTLINPSATTPEERYSGLCIDMVRHIAQSFNPPWKVEYHEVNWDTLRNDMYSGNFDFIPNVMYVTIPRLPDFDFTAPYAYMPMGIGIVRKGDARFPTFDSLNTAGVKISLVQGWTPTDLARERLPKATLLIRPMDDPAAFQFQELDAGRADIILQDASTAQLIKRSHPDKVDLLWLDEPPIRLACSFMLRSGDTEMRDFLSRSIETMVVDGTIDDLDRKWKGLADIIQIRYRSGSGRIGPSGAP